jgi:hypothetical protein
LTAGTADEGATGANIRRLPHWNSDVVTHRTADNRAVPIAITACVVGGITLSLLRPAAASDRAHSTDENHGSQSVFLLCFTHHLLTISSSRHIFLMFLAL